MKTAMKTKRSRTAKSAAAAGRVKKQPEQVISRFAKEGKLAAIGKKAVDDSFRLGLPVTQLRGNEVVQIFPDGTTHVLKVLKGNSVAKAS